MEELRYSGNWEILGKEHYGYLIINDKKGIIRLILHNRGDIDYIFNEGEVPTYIKHIKGKLIPYGVMSLLNATIIRTSANISYGTRTIELDVEYCINGSFKDYEDLKFSKFMFRLSNTFAWSGLNGLSWDYKNKTFIIKHKNKKTINYSIDNNTTISFVPCFSEDVHSSVSEHTTISQYMIIRITSRKNQNIYFYMDIIKKIKTLIEIAISESVDIKEIVAYKRNYYTMIGNTKMFNEIKVYSKDSYKDSYEEPNVRNMLFTLPTIMNNKVKLLTNWFEKYDKIKPILDLYTESIRYSNMPIERQFLNLMQALESYHARFICDTKSEYESIICNKYNNNQYLSYLLDNEQKNKDYVLIKNRLLHLFLKCNVIFFESPIRMIRFVRSITDTRHYLTHYDKSKEYKAIKGLNLQEAGCILNGLIEYYIMQEIGIDKEFTWKKIAENTARIRWRIKEIYIGNIGEKNEELYKIINLNTELSNISQNICKVYKFDEYVSDEIDYSNNEDFNYILKTKLNKYYIKIFEKRKTLDQCNEYIQENKKINKSKCDVPRMFKANGKYLYELEYYDNLYRICVREIK